MFVPEAVVVGERWVYTLVFTKNIFPMLIIEILVCFVGSVEVTFIRGNSDEIQRCIFAKIIVDF
jgi:hypothetical protein